MGIIAELTEKRPLALLLPQFLTSRPLNTGVFLQTLWICFPSTAPAPVSPLA